MKLHPIALLHKGSAVLLAFFQPFGIWGAGALALIDSGLVPLPISMDGVIIFYVVAHPHQFLLYSAISAVAAGIGSLVPFYIGRAGGELVLLKRINRERYERMRDRFERQEFLAILIPSMLPPPTPLKLFQFGAGVFEMRPLPFFLATMAGKFVQFLVCSLATIWFGPAIAHTVSHAVHEHSRIAFSLLGLILLALAIYITRRIFSRREGVSLPVEE